jgi:hypothetical protein
MEDYRVHVIPEGDTCGEGQDGDVCRVEWGEHVPLTLEEAKARRDKLDEAIRKVESRHPTKKR